MIDTPSPNHDDRGGDPIRMIVLHYTGMESADAAIKRLADPESKVSAHYVVAEDGTVVRMVDEARRAWHAGKSWWRGFSGVNSISVGIEIVNPGHEFGYVPFPEPQMDAVTRLVADIAARYRVEPAMVVGHSDVAPARKEDPGELFDWERLAKLGLATPRPEKLLGDPHWTDGGALLALQRYGYDVADGPKAVKAFQRRFRQENVDGVWDGETRSILLALLIGEEQLARSADAPI